MSAVRTDNDFSFGVSENTLRPLDNLAIHTRQQAYRTASWIVLLADAAQLLDEDPDSSYEEIFQAIVQT